MSEKPYYIPGNQPTLLRKKRDIYYDPLYKAILLPPFIQEAMNLAPMQRLRDVKQLSTLHLIYPGATHTRFEHSLGVYHLASFLFDVLFHKKVEGQRNWPELTPIALQVLQLSALFHDLGHGPMGHVFELFCERTNGYENFKHEQMTSKLILGKISNYRHIYEFILKRQKEVETEVKKMKNAKTRKLLLKHVQTLYTPEVIAKIATGSELPGEFAFLSQIISSPFDVDRMDYLRRDAYCTGFETGLSDIWSILQHTTLKRHKNNYFLRLEKEAALSVEAFLSSREKTYRTLYFNTKHRATQELIVRALFSIEKNYDPRDLALCTDNDLLSIFEKNSNPFTADVADRIKGRHLYQPLYFTVARSELSSEMMHTIGDYLNPDLTEKQKIWLNYEKEVACELKLPDKLTIIFDIRTIPAIKLHDINRPWFLDKHSGKDFSLIDLFPHLTYLYGDKEEVSDNTILKLIHKMSDIFIFVPPEALQNKYNLNIIFDHFIQFLNPNKTKKDEKIIKTLETKFIKSLQNIEKDIKQKGIFIT